MLEVKLNNTESELLSGALENYFYRVNCSLVYEYSEDKTVLILSIKLIGDAKFDMNNFYDNFGHAVI